MLAARDEVNEIADALMGQRIGGCRWNCVCGKLDFTGSPRAWNSGTCCDNLLDYRMDRRGLGDIRIFPTD